MKQYTGIVNALSAGKRVRLILTDTDTLRGGRRLFRRIQRQCGFDLVYLQKMGAEPYMLIWRSGTFKEFDHLFEVERYDA